MKGVIRLTDSTYETGDIIQIFPDDYVFDGKDLSNGRGVVDLGNLTEEEIDLLDMRDEGPYNASAMSLLPAFRVILSKTGSMKTLHRRKYHFDNGVKLKSSAQSRT